MVAREVYERIIFGVEVDVALHLYRACQPQAFGDDNRAASLCVHVSDGLIDGFRVEHHAVANGSKLHDANLVVGEGGQLYLFHLEGQTVIYGLVDGVVVFLASACCEQYGCCSCA